MDATLPQVTRRAGREMAFARARDWVVAWCSSPHVLLFCLLLVVYGYTPPRWQDWNQNSRFDLTLALVDQGSVRIDSYADNTGDYATIDGYRYSDKAPGLSLLAVPAYAIVRAARPFGLAAVAERLGRSEGFAATLDPGGAGLNDRRIEQALALYLITVATVIVLAAFLGVLLALVVERLWGCRTAGLVTALVFALATPIFTYAQAFYGHVPAATCVFAAFALLVLRPDGSLSARRLCAIGALLASAIVIEYPAALAALPVALWALALGRVRAVIFGAIGAIGPFLALMLYDLAAFGTPLPVGYAHSTLWQGQHQQGFMSVTYPKWDAAIGLLFSPFRGLFFFSPVLLIALAGIWIAFRERRQRTATLVALSGYWAVFLFTAASAMWWGGFAVGPRYLLPGLPLLAIPFGAVVAWCNQQVLRLRLLGLGSIGAIAGVSLALTWATTFARQNYPSDTIRHPLTGYVLPAFREGDIARNLGMAIQLHGVASLIPLIGILALGGVGIAATLRPARPGSVRA